MDKAVISNGSCSGGGNIKDPQMWNNSNELRFINAKGNWLDGHGFCRVWLTERESESERDPCGGGGGLNPTEQMPGLTIPPCWFTCNHSNKHNSQAWKKELLHSGERAEAWVGGSWGCCFYPACVQLYSCSSFSTYELSSISLCQGQALPGPYKRAV